MSLLLQAARTHGKNIFRHCLHTPEFESSIWLLCGNWKNNDKLYYSINLPSGKWIIFFDTVHNSVWARSWRENNRIALKVWGHCLDHCFLCALHQLPKTKIWVLYRQVSWNTVHKCWDTEKIPKFAIKIMFNRQMIFRKKLSVYYKETSAMNSMCQVLSTPNRLTPLSMSQLK